MVKVWSPSTPFSALAGTTLTWAATYVTVALADLLMSTPVEVVKLVVMLTGYVPGSLLASTSWHVSPVTGASETQVVSDALTSNPTGRVNTGINPATGPPPLPSSSDTITVKVWGVPASRVASCWIITFPSTKATNTSPLFGKAPSVSRCRSRPRTFRSTLPCALIVFASAEVNE